MTIYTALILIINISLKCFKQEKKEFAKMIEEVVRHMYGPDTGNNEVIIFKKESSEWKKFIHQIRGSW
jgi:hypothetical protein